MTNRIFAAAADPSPAKPNKESPVLPYKENYVLIGTLDRLDHADRQNEELKFQFSFKFNIINSPYFPLFLGYTQKSFWQVFDTDKSRPFRETNYNPEGFLDFAESIQKYTGYGLIFGIEHESNGQSDPLSRSLFRTYIKGSKTVDRIDLSLKYWVTIEDSDNPDIDEFLGNHELAIGYPHILDSEDILDSVGRNKIQHILLVKFRNIDRSERFSSEWNYSFQWNSLWDLLNANPRLYFHLQYFDGYGESLIDYNEKVQRIGFGFIFT